MGFNPENNNIGPKMRMIIPINPATPINLLGKKDLG
jgi:hypothetical protein